MSSKNPFADDPLPDNVVRLSSIADPLDPYAAPPGVNEYKTDRDPGVGIWRDKNWLVMHCDATFPPRCIFTNEPTETFGKQSITWAHLNDLRGKTVNLNYGLNPVKRHWLRWTQIIAGLVAVSAFILMIQLIRLHDASLYDVPLFMLMPLSLLALAGGALWTAMNASTPLTYVKSNKNYVWLAGASPAFLDSLPAWPGFRG